MEVFAFPAVTSTNLKLMAYVQADAERVCEPSVYFHHSAFIVITKIKSKASLILWNYCDSRVSEEWMLVKSTLIIVLYGITLSAFHPRLSNTTNSISRKPANDLGWQKHQINCYGFWSFSHIIIYLKIRAINVSNQLLT